MGQELIEIDLETHKLIENLRQSLHEPRLDIVKRALRIASSRSRESGSRPARRQGPASERRTGFYTVKLAGNSTIATSQKDAYKKVLLWLAGRDPAFLPRLAEEKAGSRRIVARSHAALYPRKPALADTLTPELLIDGWYVDPNLSKDQKIKRLITACALAGLQFGRDVVVDFG